MNWKLILILSLLGFVMGVASTLGLAGQFEWMMWLCIGLLSAWKFARRVGDDFFLHGFYLGILDGLFCATVQAVFISTYLANNPRMVGALSSLPQDLSPALVVLIMGPIIGTFSGIGFGILAFLAHKLIHPRAVEPPMET